MTDRPIIVHSAKPAKSAEQFKALRYPHLVNQQDEWLTWDGAAYQPVEDTTISAHISEFLKDAKTMIVDDQGKQKLLPFNPKSGDVREVSSALKLICHAPRDTMSPPVWLKGTPPEYLALDPRNLISLQNGLLDVTTRKLYPATPCFFTRTALAIDYQADAPKPKLWLSFLDEIMQGRQPLVDLIQEMQGYLISTATSMHKVFFLFGRPRSGKGTILRVTTALVGKRNTCFPTIETMGAQFGLQGCIGKSVAQVTDMNTDNRGHLGTAASRINAISGEDGVTVERKHTTSWDGNLGVRFVLTGNTLPNFGTHTNAMTTRLLIVPFDVSFAGKEDRNLTDKLLAELPGILNWALDGLENLRMRGDFAEPEESATAKLRLMYKSDPIHGFVAECCTVTGNSDAGTDKAIFYDAFQRYCAATGTRAPALKDFTEKLLELFPIVSNSRRRTGSGDHQEWCYRGIELNDALAVKFYKTDPQFATLTELGFEVRELLMRDAGGWPIPLDSAARASADFDA